MNNFKRGDDRILIIWENTSNIMCVSKNSEPLHNY